MKMMNLKNAFRLLLFSILLVTFSCADPVADRIKADADRIKNNENVNNWIQSNMDEIYYWNTEMPAKRDLTLSPTDFYKSLLYTPEDHFSYIASDYTELQNLLSGVQKEAGYDFNLFRESDQNQNVVGVINYIKPNSPASLTKLKRGDIFSKINGTVLTTDNYQDMLSKLSAPHTLGVWGDSTIVTVSLDVVEYNENPIFLDSIYDMGSEKVAYLIYNFFAADKGDNSYTYLKQLNDIFGKFKDNNVDELILDLRYNTGGDASVATALASMISNRSSSDLFCINQYNSIVDHEFKNLYGDNYNKTFFDDNLPIFDKDGNATGQNIPVNKLPGLSRLYVLTSGNTASASELIINGLKPYMPVILVGDVTYGKNMGMWFIYETDPQKQKDNRWGMLPIVLKILNSESQSDYTNGFTPDYPVDEYFLHNPDGSIIQYTGLFPLGDVNEYLLAAALANISGQVSVLRSAQKSFVLHPLASSIDRTPVRKNMIVPKKLSK